MLEVPPFRWTLALLLSYFMVVQSAMAGRNTTYLHTDALGSVAAASDSGGRVLWRKMYEPYGHQIGTDNTNETLSFTGKPEDETGLSYFGARYYDPQAGRFMGIDPVGVLGQADGNPLMFNRYTYANDNPYKYVDPDGREAIIKVEGNNIDVRIPIKYSGKGATPDTINKFNKGIQDHWTGKFGEYNVTTTVTDTSEHGVMNEISVPEGNGRAYVVGGNKGVWPEDRPAWTAAHEAGHLMGLDDKYDGDSGKPDPGWEDNIMGRRDRAADSRNITDAINDKKNIVKEIKK